MVKEVKAFDKVFAVQTDVLTAPSRLILEWLLGRWMNHAEKPSAKLIDQGHAALRFRDDQQVGLRTLENGLADEYQPTAMQLILNQELGKKRRTEAVDGRLG